MKKYPNLTPQQIEDFKTFALENNLGDWTTGITQEMSPEQVGDRLIARKKVRRFKNLSPQDVIAFEDRIMNAMPWSRMEYSTDITPEELKELGKAIASMIEESRTKSNSGPMTPKK